MRFEIAKRPVRQVIEQRRNLGKESLAVTSWHEAAEKTLVGFVSQATTQLAVQLVDALECAPRRHRVTWHVEQHTARGVEKDTLVNHLEHDHLLNPATQQLQLPGLHKVTRQAQQLAILAHSHHQLELAVIQRPFLPGFVGVYQHGVAAGIYKAGLHAPCITGGL
ncbi:hypothetical protein NP537_10385 [Pseudomonas kurunegalensis]|nr:hypothetical protein [Pseudomonas kurunegalensis]